MPSRTLRTTRWTAGDSRGNGSAETGAGRRGRSVSSRHTATEWRRPFGRGAERVPDRRAAECRRQVVIGKAGQRSPTAGSANRGQSMRDSRPDDHPAAGPPPAPPRRHRGRAHQPRGVSGRTADTACQSCALAARLQESRTMVSLLGCLPTQPGAGRLGSGSSCGLGPSTGVGQVRGSATAARLDPGSKRCDTCSHQGD